MALWTMHTIRRSAPVDGSIDWRDLALGLWRGDPWARQEAQCELLSAGLIDRSEISTACCDGHNGGGEG